MIPGTRCAEILIWVFRGNSVRFFHNCELELVAPRGSLGLSFFAAAPLLARNFSQKKRPPAISALESTVRC